MVNSDSSTEWVLTKRPQGRLLMRGFDVARDCSIFDRTWPNSRNSAVLVQACNDGYRIRWHLAIAERCAPTRARAAASPHSDSSPRPSHWPEGTRGIGVKLRQEFPQLRAGLKVINCRKRRKNLFALFTSQEWADRAASDQAMFREALKQLALRIKSWLNDTDFALVIYKDGFDRKIVTSEADAKVLSMPIAFVSFGRTPDKHERILEGILRHPMVRDMGIRALPSFMLEPGSNIAAQLKLQERKARAFRGYATLSLMLSAAVAAISVFYASSVTALLTAWLLFAAALFLRRQAVNLQQASVPAP